MEVGRNRAVCCACCLTCAIALSANAETLQHFCERVESLIHDGNTDAPQTAVNECSQLWNDQRGIISTEKDEFVQERFYALRADALQHLAAKLEKKKLKDPATDVKKQAFAAWQDYFEWFDRLPDEKRTAIVNEASDKVFAAAAGLGTNAIETSQCSSACAEYERMQSQWLGTEALDYWVANLICPEEPPRPIRSLFLRVFEEPTLVTDRVGNPEKKPHWKMFFDRVADVIKSKRFHRPSAAQVQRFQNLTASTNETASSSNR
jgi:hypothetical protein